MSWMPLADFTRTDETHPDAASAVEAVRAALARVSVRYLAPQAVWVDAAVQYRGAWFRFPHAGEPEAEVRFRQGDGWFHFESPLGNYDGYIADEDLEGFLVAMLTGFLCRVEHRRGRALVGTSWRWWDPAGQTRQIGMKRTWQAGWRRALRLAEWTERRCISFDRVPAVSARIDEAAFRPR
jgi:hypothetical protein